MLNREKVILMTKLSIYEQNEGRKEIPLSKYFRSDYIGLHLIGSFFAITIAYAFVVALVVAYRSDYLMKKLTSLNFFKMGKEVLIGYIFFLAVNMLIAYLAYLVKFVKIRKNLKSYNGRLKQLRKMYEQEKFGDDDGGDDNANEHFGA